MQDKHTHTANFVRDCNAYQCGNRAHLLLLETICKSRQSEISEIWWGNVYILNLHLQIATHLWIGAYLFIVMIYKCKEMQMHMHNHSMHNCVLMNDILHLWNILCECQLDYGFVVVFVFGYSCVTVKMKRSRQKLKVPQNTVENLKEPVKQKDLISSYKNVNGSFPHHRGKALRDT